MEHKWMTDWEVALLEDGQKYEIPTWDDVNRLIADRSKRQELLARLVMKDDDWQSDPGVATCHLGRYCLYCEYEGGFHGNYAKHDSDCPIQQGREMLKAVDDE